MVFPQNVLHIPVSLPLFFLPLSWISLFFLNVATLMVCTKKNLVSATTEVLTKAFENYEVVVRRGDQSCIKSRNDGIQKAVQKDGQAKYCHGTIIITAYTQLKSMMDVK